MRTSIAILLVTCGLCGVAVADNVQDALRELDRGVALFQAGDLVAAREAFAQARTLVPDKANPYRWLGLVDARLGRCREAVEELDTFLSRIPPTDARSAEAITVRDRCRQDLQPTVGTLAVDSSPSGAEVRLDDPDKAPVGVTPYRNESVPAGSHLVFLRKQGFEQAVKAVSVGRNETVRLELPLQPVAVAPAAPAPVLAAPVAAAPTPPERKKSKLWIIGAVAGGVAVLALGVGLGVGLAGGRSADTVLPPVTSP